MNDIAIKAEHVSKKFCQSLRYVMTYGAADITRDFFSIKSKTEELRDGEFWAVNDVSFELKRGDTLGIIGLNGSGKSTILKMLNGIYMPDQGRLEIKGRVGALIEVGAGFHPMLTGRENIYVNGAILGLNKREIDKKFDEIVDFADIGDFLDSPVKHYSSGMHVRLGFAVAIHAEPDILLVDEVLAVGDIAFQNKCLNAISNQFKLGDTTVIFVSHDMNAMRLLCDRCLLLNNGVVMLDDSPLKAIDNFGKILFKERNTNQSEILKVNIVDKTQKIVNEVDCRGNYSLIVELNNLQLEKGLMLAFSFVNLENKFSYRLETEKFKKIKGKIFKKRIFIHFKEINLPRGTYTIRFAISDGSYSNRKHYFDEMIYFSVKDSVESPRFLQAEWSEDT